MRQLGGASQMSFIAQYHGICRKCEEEVKGTEVVFVDLGILEHVNCPDPLPADGPVCPRCWTIHKGECL